MNVIQPNCRVQFSAEDVAFVIATVGASGREAECLTALLTDPGARDQILDDPRLYRALLERGGCLRVSERLYFYVLVRTVLRRSGLKDTKLADYVAELLAEFTLTERTRVTAPGSLGPMEYYSDLLLALQRADERNGFALCAHMGNYSLFLTGLFPERIRHQAGRRGFPGLDYYEQLGRMSFRAASDHRLARRSELAHLFGTLSERFHDTRLALNDLSDRVFSLGEPGGMIDRLLGQNPGPAAAN